MKKDLVILLYVTLQCNRRCYYCVVNFKDQYIWFDNVNDIINFLIKIRSQFNKITIEFFGGEPLLAWDKIKYFIDLTNQNNLNLNYKITTNWLLLNQEIVTYFDKYFDIIYVSLNDINKLYLDKFKKIITLINKKEKYYITFIYHPNICYKTHIKILNYLISLWYNQFNILPVYMYKNYSLEEFENLENFLKYTKILSKKRLLKFNYFYFITNKKELEFSIVPNWDISLDTWETIFDMKKNDGKDLIAWNIKNISINNLIDRIEKFQVEEYIKDFLNKWYVKQSYKNFMELSNLLKKYS